MITLSQVCTESELCFCYEALILVKEHRYKLVLVNLNQSFTFFCKYLKTADLNSATVSYTTPLVHINLDWLFTCDIIHQMSRINYSYTVQTYCRY